MNAKITKKRTDGETIEAWIVRSFAALASWEENECQWARDLRAAVDAGQQWKWRRAERLLDKVYRAFGAENEYTGHAWHTGRHPLQAAIAEAEERGVFVGL